MKCMNQRTKDLLKTIENWPEQDQQELAEVIRDIEARRNGVYHATPEELEAIDEALGEIARGEIAGKEDIDAAFAKFRRA